ncbi:hypothetical protein EON63_17190 [archaeon]|nr:MAG: hypothetical protein EON63_17190 [archaeon]
MSIQLPISECHRFHSPVDWHIRSRTHIPGNISSSTVRLISIGSHSLMSCVLSPMQVQCLLWEYVICSITLSYSTTSES